MSPIMNPSKPQSKPIGVRLSNDAEHFLANLTSKGSPGEGTRHLVQKAMESHESPTTVEESQSRLLGVLGDAPNVFHHPPRSVVAEDIVREALLVLATVHVGPAAASAEQSEAQTRKAFEAGVIDRAFDFVDTLFRHSLSAQAAAWAPDAVRQRLMGSRELLVATLAAVAKDHPAQSRG